MVLFYEKCREKNNLKSKIKDMIGEGKTVVTELGRRAVFWMESERVRKGRGSRRDPGMVRCVV